MAFPKGPNPHNAQRGKRRSVYQRRGGPIVPNGVETLAFTKRAQVAVFPKEQRPQSFQTGASPGVFKVAKAWAFPKGRKSGGSQKGRCPSIPSHGIPKGEGGLWFLKEQRPRGSCRGGSLGLPTRVEEATFPRGRKP